MSTLSDIAARRAGAIVHVPGSAIVRWWAAYTTWRIERLAIACPEAMSDRQLEDIGLVRSQIGFAVRGGSERNTAGVALPPKRTF